MQVPDERKTLTGFPALHWEIVFAGSTADGYLTFSGELRGDDSVSIGKLVFCPSDDIPRRSGLPLN